MKNKKTNIELYEICTYDRYRAFKNMQMPISKKLNVDLIVKYIILIVNSFGFRKCENIIFVDEVSNNSMCINLYNTYNHCSSKSSIISLRKRIKRDHAKCGILFSVFQFLVLIFGHFAIYLLSIIFGFSYIKKYSCLLLISLFQNYIRRITNNNITSVYVMTDHNFYSSIICNAWNIDSYVLQHGIILDLSYYNISLANHFYAWGTRSKNILKDDERVVVKGTYKFENLNKTKKCKCNVLLYCVSITDFSLVSNKIEIINDVFKKKGYNIAVKLHPGSFFSNTGLNTKFKNIRFYKEEKISDIDFDLAIIENSTVLIDLLYLNKKFIIYDTNDSYFSIYPSIPLAKNKEELTKIAQKIENYNYDALQKTILKEELNSGKCDIFN